MLLEVKHPVPSHAKVLWSLLKHQAFVIDKHVQFQFSFSVIEMVAGRNCLAYTKSTATSRHTPTEIKDLQADLSRLEDWSTKWQLRFNADKCKVLHIGRDNEHYKYYMDRYTHIGVTTNE